MKISKSDLIKACKLKCRECTCDQILEIKECSIESCPLLPIKNLFFNGKNHIDVAKSNRGMKELSPEHKAKLATGREKAKQAKLNNEAHI